MQRLRLDGEEEPFPSLGRLPEPVDAPCELIAALVSAMRVTGADVSYVECMGLSGTAFMLRKSRGPFAHVDATRGRERFVTDALADLGFGDAQVVNLHGGIPEALVAELKVGRAPVARGCFPEALWRVGIVVGLVSDNLWSVLDCSGRVHALAPRADFLLLVGAPGEKLSPAPSVLLWRCLDAWEGMDEDEGVGGWRHWVEALRAEPELKGEAARVALSAHEVLYETLLDARAAGATWLADLAERAGGMAGDWLEGAARKLYELAELLDSRHPPVHHPDTEPAFRDAAWRAKLAALLSEAAELDLSAKHDVAQAIEADYPPGGGD